jgi:hypothetical protein
MGVTFTRGGSIRFLNSLEGTDVQGVIASMPADGTVNNYVDTGTRDDWGRRILVLKYPPVPAHGIHVLPSVSENTSKSGD